MVRLAGWVAVVVGGVLFAGEGNAQTQSRCADCHFANPGSVSANHLSEWDSSGHGRKNVGCDAPRGGDPRSFEPFVAHKDILARTNPASPVHPTNLPEDVRHLPHRAAGCLPAQNMVPTAEGRQQERAHVHDLPREAAGNRLSPKALEGQCATCHGAGHRPAPRVPGPGAPGRRRAARGAGPAQGREERHRAREGQGPPSVARAGGTTGGSADHRSDPGRSRLRL